MNMTIRICPECKHENKFDPYQVDGYGFQDIVCKQCGAVSNYRGVIGHSRPNDKGESTVTWTNEEWARRMAINMREADRDEDFHTEECRILWSEAISAGEEGDAVRFEETCKKGIMASKDCWGCAKEETK